MDIAIIVLLVVVIVALVLLFLRVQSQARMLGNLPDQVDRGFESRHRAMLVDLHGGLTQQGDRLGEQVTGASERLRGSVGAELTQIGRAHV